MYAWACYIDWKWGDPISWFANIAYPIVFAAVIFVIEVWRLDRE